MLTAQTPLVDAVGKKSADALHKAFEMSSVSDLLMHYPRRHQHIGEASREDELQEGDHVSFIAEVLQIQWHINRKTQYQSGGGRRGRVSAKLALQQGTIEAVFWNQPWIEKALPPGTTGLFTGIVGKFRDTWQLSSATVERFAHSAEIGEVKAGLTYLNLDDWVGRLMPVYPSTSSLDSGAIRRCVELVLGMVDEIPDPLPADVRRDNDLIDYDTAVRHIHLPPSQRDLERAQARMKFQEALSTQLALAAERSDERARAATAYSERPGGALDGLDQQLPYSLTDGQREVGDVLSAELTREHPMHRLLQGDVGSGKTVVALRAMLQVADSGGQCALLAPTEVLAHQHARSILDLLGPLGRAGMLDGHPDAIKIVVLTSGMPAAARRSALLDIASGTASIVIGTHALLEPTVTFADLGLVVIDEQHRFGVQQRDRLRQKGAQGRSPHTLVMTATPIPRTMAITAFGALESIALEDMPPGRLPIATTAIAVRQNPGWVSRAWERIREEVAAGHQAFVVCPRIDADDSEADAADEVPLDDEPAKPPSVHGMAEFLASGPLHDLRIDVLHGKLSSDEKDRVMARFLAGDINVLVATTVIEVGVDVPNATVMVIAGADRFGLATLHQLRGRVGRGSAPGVCLLLSEYHPNSRPFARLRVLEETTNGFRIAERDLEFRHEGDVLGVVQSGTRTRLRLLRLHEVDIIERARAVCERIVSDDPSLQRYPLLKAELDRLRQAFGAEFLTKS